mgnify:CR=1 FL=1
MDISAGSGKDYATVAGALAKVNDGNVNALKRLGITMGEQTENFALYNKEQAALSKAQADAGNALDQFGPKSKEYAKAQEKVAQAQDDVNAVTSAGIDWQKELAGQFEGQSATAAGTLEGKMGRLKLIFSETKESIGAALLPALTNVGTWVLEKGVPLFRGMAEDIMPKLKVVWEKISATIEENRPGLERIGQALAATDRLYLGKLRAGERVALMGRPGSGKSTLLAVIAGLLAPTHGQVWVGGDEMTAMSERWIEFMQSFGQPENLNLNFRFWW